ncbi:MAG: GntR family transcriptional regulator, partial [Oscillospiraceae bacterium]|nr:GntR family transcriptional regulator [Oscillospiraceae bacterium]
RANRQVHKKIPEPKLIQDSIEHDLIRGVYEKGSMIPKQEFFSQKFGVSRTTVRKATDELIRNGILVSIKGKGTYVCDYGENVHLPVRPIIAERTENRHKLLSRTLSIETIPATEAIAKQLRIPTGNDVVRIERVRLLDGKPLCIQISFLNGVDVKDVVFTKEYLDEGSLFRLLEEKAGLVAAFQDEVMRAIGCPPRIAACLDMEPQAPVIMIFRTAYARDGRVMEYCEDYENTDFQGLSICTRAIRNF